ncbi:conjugal transfer protein TraR [Acinetobacter lactucae]|nr:TraR/DksA C4-type zinc finger protein [Acinetobacter lactucae]ARD27817.1 conjugal transfer protein TraR [Acinetobacter lactucae]
MQPKDFSRPSLSECEECGNDIPIERQRYGSVTLCVECKNTQKKLSYHYR